MTIPIHMPALSPTMETGNLAKWLVKEGDAVAPGDFLAEIETDKATMELETIDEGIVGKILVADGAENIPVGTLIAVLLEEGESESVIDAGEAAPAPAPKSEPAPAPAPASAPAPKKKATPKVAAAASTPPPAAPAPAAPAPPGARIKASPLAKRLAAAAGIEIASLAGSGPGGRIIKSDVDAAKSAAAPIAPVAPAAPAGAAAPAGGLGDVLPPPDGVPREETRLSGMRRIIARRLTHAKQTVPHFYLTMDAEIDRLLDLRKRLNIKLAEEGARDKVTKISVNDFIIRAVALALVKVPDANVQFGGDVMYRFTRADISVAVATPGGLITPVIRGAEEKGLAAISAEVKDLAARAQEGKLAPEEYQGGTFSISNLGMFGVKEFSAVINPPQAAILAVGAGEPRAIVRHGAVQTATLMSMTLSCDHRAIDGAVGAKFLGVLKGYLEEPGSMLL